MAIQRITPDDIETFTLETNPSRTYASSSVSGVTGSVYLFARRSLFEKEIYPLSAFSASLFSDQNLDDYRLDILRQTSSVDISSGVTTYLSAVRAQGISARKQQTLEIHRLTPPFSLNSDSLRKKVIVDHLMPYYRTSYPRAQYTITNYNCLNFYTASNVPTSSVLLYPNPIKDSATSQLTQYGFTGSFSFDFWIRPKYTPDLPDAPYKPGCIFHLTGGYAVCLHSGSARDINGNLNAFRLSLQLTSAANVVPDLITSAMANVFFSDDNCLPRDKWSHVTIKWGGSGYNQGTGSFVVDSTPCGYFVITSSMEVGTQAIGDPSVLCVGNYYEGQNNLTTAMSYFFTNDTAEREGLYELQGGAGFGPSAFAFRYPLNAEVHDLKLYNKYLTTTEIEENESDGPELSSNLLFYLPPFFTRDSPTRSFYDGAGGIPVTPFFGKDGASETPFAKEMAFGCGGHYINLENYVRDFASGRYARLWDLSGSTINTATTVAESANTILYKTGSNIKRLYTILPCDNGNFTPNFNLLSTLNTSSFVNDLGNYEPGVISLRNMISGAFAADVMVQPTGSIVSALMGGNDPEDFGTIPGNSLAIYHRTRDASSNQVVVFDISNMFYGQQIKPGSLVLRETRISGSSNKFGFTFRDDGAGNLYRANALNGPHATWASVGNVFYNEGLVIIKYPQLYFFGLTEFELEFKGVQNIHVMTVNAFARPMQLISSSNPSYRTGSLDDDLANEYDSNYVFLTHVNLHDDNLNVISRTAIAQPMVKRSGDKFLFKIKMDY